ncbi:neuromedin-U receptor 1-like [Babylonia areolata]|uniref:neuromedin-U receptor 1-like n=1 Tax=Babylonia areolata TaxID=304850 RepID=UPI003FD64A63
MTYNRTLLVELNDEVVLVLLPAILCLAALMLVGSVGNFLTIYIFGWKLKPTTQNCLFMWLGVFDIISCLVGIPSEIVDMRRYYLYEDVIACKVMRFILAIPSVASANLLVVIAVDRYRRVCKPLHSQMELIHARIGVGVAALVAVVLAGPAFSLYGKRTVQTSVEGLNGCDCSVQDKYVGQLFPLIYEILFGVLFLLYTVILAVLYTRVWLQTRRHHRYMATHSIPPLAYSSLLNLETDDSSENADAAAENAAGRKTSRVATADITVKIRKSLRANKLTVIAFAVTLVFVLSYLPHLVLITTRSVIEGFDYQQTGAKLWLYNLFLRSFFVNSVANVFVYSAMNNEFRAECRKMCCFFSCKKRCRRQHTTPPGGQAV